MWINGVIAWQVHKLLRHSKQRKLYHPPTRKEVCCHMAIVYTYAAFVASWTLIGVLPHHANALGGTACLPTEYSVTSTIFFWCAFIPAMIGFPIIYVLYVCYDVRKNNLLPVNGRTRQLALFFSRIIVIFIIMWLPTVILLFVVAVRNYWISVIGGFFSHLQGLVSSVFSMMKPDIRQAVWDFISCAVFKNNSDEEYLSPGIGIDNASTATQQRSDAIILSTIRQAQRIKSGMVDVFPNRRTKEGNNIDNTHENPHEILHNAEFSPEATSGDDIWPLIQ